MLKKLLPVSILFLLIGLFFPKVSLAACQAPGQANQCARGYVGCVTGATKTCCSVADGGCDQAPGSIQQTPIPGGGIPGGSTTTGSELCGDGIDTAIGCIPVLADDNGVSFMGFILRWSVGIGGGIAFVLILYGSFMVMTSQANPERIKAGQELLGSSISGLILLILSIFLLNFIGVDILGLDTFGFGQ